MLVSVSCLKRSLRAEREAYNCAHPPVLVAPNLNKLCLSTFCFYVVNEVLGKRKMKRRGKHSRITMYTVKAILCKIASSVATLATHLWNELKVAKLQPVIQRRTLFLVAKIQRSGTLYVEMTPVRSAKATQN